MRDHGWRRCSTGIKFQLKNSFPQPLCVSPRTVCTPSVHNALCPDTNPFCPHLVPMSSPCPGLSPLATTFVTTQVPWLKYVDEPPVQSIPAPVQTYLSPVFFCAQNPATSVQHNLAPVLQTPPPPLVSTASLDPVSSVPVARRTA